MILIPKSGLDLPYAEALLLSCKEETAYVCPFPSQKRCRTAQLGGMEGSIPRVLHATDITDKQLSRVFNVHVLWVFGEG